MTIIIHCDASTKNGWGCWVYIRSDQLKPKAGIIKSMNTCAVENLAAIKALQNVADDQAILLISDSLGTIEIINSPDGRVKKNLFGRTKLELIQLCYNKKIEGLWVASKHPCPTHQQVDSLAKAILNDWLKSIQHHE